MSEFDGVIAIDAMGGDFGPSVTVPAAITAMKEPVADQYYDLGTQLD